MTRKPVSMHEAIGEIEAYYTIEKVRKRFKRMFSGLGVDKYVEMYIYRLHSVPLRNLLDFEDRFVIFMETIEKSDSSGNTQLGVTKDMVEKVRNTASLSKLIKRKKGK
jgi:hypothetical protein